VIEVAEVLAGSGCRLDRLQAPGQLGHVYPYLQDGYRPYLELPACKDKAQLRAVDRQVTPGVQASDVVQPDRQVADVQVLLISHRYDSARSGGTRPGPASRHRLRTPFAGRSILRWPCQSTGPWPLPVP